MNGKESQSIQLPKEIIKAERARSNRLLIIAVIASNLFLYFILSGGPPATEVAPVPTRVEYSSITLKVENYVPTTNELEQRVSLMKENKVVARNCFLKGCQGEKCTIEVPSSRVYTLMKHSTIPLKLIPRVKEMQRLNKGKKREFTI